MGKSSKDNPIFKFKSSLSILVIIDLDVFFDKLFFLKKKLYITFDIIIFEIRKVNI